MAKVLEGVFMADVIDVSAEVVGEKETPMIKVHFNPVQEKVGDEFQDRTELPKVNKGYFLSMDLVQKGKHAGKSRVEALKADFESSYGYTGNFNPTAMKDFMVGKRFEIVCKASATGYTDVQFVNLPGQKKGRKPVKHLSTEQLAAFDKLWSGTPTTAPKDPASLFAQLSGNK